VPEGAADRGGLVRGDLLVALDGTPLTDASDLQRLMSAERIGRRVPAVVVRGGRPRTLELTLDELR
jgi:S1-C subfamily serine protease